MTSATFGSDNALPLVGPLIISEVMYHPPGGLPGPESDYEFVEIMNTGPGATGLSGVRLADEVRYTFPAGESIAPGERILVAASPQAFAAAYAIPPGTRVFGPWQGSLDDWLETPPGRCPSNGRAIDVPRDGHYPIDDDAASNELAILRVHGLSSSYEGLPSGPGPVVEMQTASTE